MSKRGKILIVDDERDSIEGLKDILEDNNFEVDAVDDGQKAVQRLKQTVFDIILLDIKMPVMDGVELYKKIKEICKSQGTVVIMMTAYSVDELMKEAIHEGVYAIFRKPLNVEELLDTIRQAKEGALVLVVEDDPETAKSIKYLLEDNGYRVNVVSSGEAAVEYAKKHTQDIILLDVKLPVMNGLEAYLKIREINPHSVAIMMTAYREEVDEIVRQALDNSAYTCLYKPLDPPSLLKIVGKLAEKKRKGEAIQKPHSR